MARFDNQGEENVMGVMSAHNMSDIIGCFPSGFLSNFAMIILGQQSRFGR